VVEDLPTLGEPVPQDLPLLEMTDPDADLAVPLVEEEVHPGMFEFDNDPPLELPSEQELRKFLSQLEKPRDEE